MKKNINMYLLSEGMYAAGDGGRKWTGIRDQRIRM